jgi:hypothetical protein
MTLEKATRGDTFSIDHEAFSGVSLEVSDVDEVDIGLDTIVAVTATVGCTPYVLKAVGDDVHIERLDGDGEWTVHPDDVAN